MKSNHVLLIIAFLIIVAYFLFGRRSVKPNVKDYAERARTDEINSSYVSSHADRFHATNALRTIEARKQVADGLAGLYKKEGEARIAQSENDLQVIRHQLAHDLEKLQHNNSSTVLEKSTEAGLTPLTYEQEKLIEHQTSETIRLEQEKTELEIKKHREMKDVDMDVYRFEKEIDIKGAIIARVAPMYEVELLTQQLQKALFDKDNLLLTPESETKTKMLTRLNKNIKLLNEAIDAKGKGLIQGTNRRELGPVEED